VRQERKERQGWGKGQTASSLSSACRLLFPPLGRSLRALRTLRLRHAFTYERPRLWITFWREFWGVFWGDFLEPIGPGASVQGDFSADGVPLVRWASADFATFCSFLRGFWPVLGAFCGHWALFASMSCAYLYVNNYFSASLAWDLRSLHRRERGERRERQR